MVRSPRKETQTVLKKGAWAPEEDRKLIAYIHRYGIWNWSQMPTFAGLSRSGKSCRLRWLNYLSPDVKRGNFTEKEVEIIISMYQKFGSRWSLIAKELPGRTDNEVKNYWHTRLKKLLSISKNNLVPSVHEDDDDDDNNSDPELVPIQENPHEEIKPSVLHFPQVSILEGYNYQQLAADDTSSSGSDDADDQGRRQLETAFAEMNISGDSHNSHEIHNNNNIPSSWTEDFMLENFCMEEEDIFPSWSPLVDPLYPTFCFYNDLYCDILFNFSDKRGTADSEEPFFSF